MAIIIETCPKCGHDLVDEVICTNPPIPKKSCWNCGWHWEGEREEVIRVPFGGNSYMFDKGGLFGSGTCLNGSIYNEAIKVDHSKLTTSISNFGNNDINISEAQQTMARLLKEYNEKFVYKSLKQGF